MLNIVCTSKPCDGLLYYSYEYCSHLNEEGIRAQVYVITHRDFTSGDYTESLSDKYIHCKDIVFNNEYIADNSITMIMGNSMMTLAHMGWRDYTKIQKASLKKLFGNKLISVYSENHPTYYPKAEKFFSPKQIISLCDTDVYPNGVGNHFEKIINFDIYKEPKDEIEFEHLFLGTNREYYKTIQEVIHEYPNHGILTYHQDRYLDLKNNNLRSPVKNLLGKFKTYVYTKDTWDPAPRIFQECRYFNKKIIYLRDNPDKDGGYWYWKRGIKKQDISEILAALDIFKGKISLTTELVTTHPVKQIGSLPQADNLDNFLSKVKLVDRINNNEVWFCSIPFLMAFTDEEGDYSQCNFGVRSEKTLHDTSLKDWMTGDIMENLRSEMVDPNSGFEYVNHYCTKCLNDEKDINRSRRIIANENYRIDEQFKSWPMIMDSATNTMKGKPYIFKDRILEIQVKSFGIECNLDCHMCHHFSSSIRTKMAFDEGVWNDVVWGDIVEKKQRSKKAMAIKPVDEINNQIVELAPYINFLKIIGGEPLVMKKHYELLDKLIEIDEAKNIRIKYQTNGTVTKAGKHNIFNYIPKFKQVLITISLDGVGRYNDYIRRRSDYATIIKNIEEFSKYKNVFIVLNSVVTFFSVLHLYEIQSFLGQYPHNWWRIDYPTQMKCNNLPQKIKDRLIPKYKQIPYMHEIVKLLQMPVEDDFNAKELYKYCMDMDKSYEGTKWEMDLLNVFPELKEHYEEISNE
jgi:sulfatase maturation enzyme AslB (radical SAM superfamily)